MESQENRVPQTGVRAFSAGLELTGSLLQDVGTFFKLHKDQDTWDHTLKVTSQAVRIARLYGADARKAEQAALLHDISNVIPVGLMPQVAELSGVKVLEEELRYPRILHQKLSRAMAEAIFGIRDTDILQAIECHTTLKPQASLFDKVVFIADKVAWDLPGEHAYLQEIRRLVDDLQLNGAVLTYLNQVWERREQMKLVHSWLIGAREELLERERASLEEGSPVKMQLLRMFRHMAWANRKIVNALQEEESLPERPFQLFGHILAAEATWLARLQGAEGKAGPLWSAGKGKIEHYTELAEENIEGFRQFMAAVNDGKLKEQIHYRTSNGESFATSIEDILTHVALHGSYHRGQIAASLRMAEIAPPATDYIFFVRGD
ncbi:bis(5'-nucleosyl)-tetraphosphatase (symmetrical) YqeK [Paenibacillus sanfengchensis]|uniref:bis(5'-nucleosyl)-tetraphosphatase (symmetrical) YqeK n=1 Tax=Paenibacillus sanfengchensis TaxID=3119819 RepID=UPI002FE1DD46